RADRAGRADHFALGLGPFDGAAGTAAGELDGDRALPLEHDAVHQRVGHQLQVRALQGRVQIGPRGARAAPSAARLLAPADAVAVGSRQVVQVLAVFETDLFARLQRGRADRRPVDLRG